MYKKYFVAALLFIGLIGFSQQTVGEIPLELKKDKNVFQIVDAAKKEVLLFLGDKTNLRAIRLDGKMAVIDSLTAARPEKEYDGMIGYNYNDTNYRLFWASSDNKMIVAQIYDFAAKKVSSQKYSLVLKNEKVLQKFTDNNKFYILTALKDSNTIKFYVFDKDGKPEEKTVSLSASRFYNYDNIRTDFYNLVRENLLPFEAPFSLTKINTESPTSLTESGKKRKCYVTDKKFTLTLDTNFDYTQMIAIDLEKFTAAESIVAKPFIPFVNRDDLNSNSFLLNDKLYQVKISYSKLILSIKDLDDENVKDYTVENDINIPFKNSDIIQENGDIKSTKVLERTTQFMRKINNANLGISGYALGKNNLITIGSVSDQKSGGGPALYGAPFGALGVLVAYAIVNPTYNNFNSYADRRVVYINCLFNDKSEHVKGPVGALAFDNIRKFAEELKDASSHTLFKFDGAYYLGYYANKDKAYLLKKFDE